MKPPISDATHPNKREYNNIFNGKKFEKNTKK
jgi:hypothetical protein